MPHGNVQRRRGREYRERPDQNGNERHGQRDAGLAHAVVLQILPGAFLLTALQARRAKVLIVQFNVAERAKEASTIPTGHNRLFLWMIKAARFSFHEQVLRRLAANGPAKAGRENKDLEPGTALGARHELRSVEELRRKQRGLAVRARQCAGVHLPRLSES